MVYAIGIFGFVLGFFVGQMLLFRLLKNKTKEELTQNKSVIWIYGLMNWAIAALFSYIFVTQYMYFMSS